MTNLLKICIIGGSGFLGTRLVNLLHSQGITLQNIDKNQSIQFPTITEIQDIRDPEGLKRLMRPADCVIHLAAEHKDDVSPHSLYYDVNVQGTRNILEAMDHAGIKRIIFTSTVAIYGLNKENPDENSPPDPFNHYGKSKWKAEEIIREWQEKGEGRSAVILRPSVIFGENNRGNVYTLLRQITSGHFLMIGGGKNVKSMAYVGNVAAFIFFIMSRNPSGFMVYNYTDLPNLTTNEIIRIAREELNIQIPPVRIPFIFGLTAGYLFDFAALVLRRKFNISSVRIRKFCASTLFNAGKAHGTGFMVPYTLKKALQQTILFEFSPGKPGSK